MHSFIHAFVRSFIHSFIHFISFHFISFIRSFVHSFIRSFVRSFIHSFILSFISFHFISLRSLTHTLIIRSKYPVSRTMMWCLDTCLWIMCPSLQDCQKFTLTRAAGRHFLLWRTNSKPHRSQWSRRTIASWLWWCHHCKQSQGCRGSTWGYMRGWIRLVISFFSSWSCLLLGS